ncbi:MAG: hemolysin family protein [Yaniella sp.]|uniref:CNNM domain-containing protein n=1 Tax=Yaniella sp. TaxID=2773929 RepID=UPI002649449D|nr:hemolysin family protein [Yaniella sp.]MDN5705157.1 hemolysin family protein [Yaniella sp.]MDN5731048.1 hemolysin family protein [Yaniella sp.]MDN5742409.1 hemolysin family protein [Yaniella sp.]MDN5815061.1 hemolysin family protein [Yaniella sp.]MDN5817695.1 hemolysin family protein [Yaniella sp.]
MSNPWIVLLSTIGIIGLSAFFVIIEFSLMGARPHRLEDKAQTSRGARAALRGTHELTIMLAGAQLGITACTFALGAVTKPAVDAWLTPAFEALGLPGWLINSASFVVSLLVVTFLHLVVGEMAPKSWAIAHPERAAVAIGLPARGFVRLLGPLLRWINDFANRLVAASGVEPVDRAAVGGRDAATIRRLVEHSADTGALEDTIRSPISEALELETLRVEDLISPHGAPTSVAADDCVADIQAAVLSSGHMRILVTSNDHPAPGVVHVRDTLLEPAARPAAELAREAFTVAAGTPVHEALTDMRHSSEQLAIVMDQSKFLGIITFNDAVSRLLPRRETAGN